MTNVIRQLTLKGDPMVRVQVPAITLEMLKASAKKNKRRVQDQFIKTLAESFTSNEAFTSILAKYVPDIKEVYKQKQKGEAS